MLANEAEQAAQKAEPISATSLTAPIQQRRHLMSAPGGPLEHLQSAANRLSLAFYGIAGSSGLLSAFAFVTETAQAATASGGALLGLTFAAWQLQGGWKKAQRKFWANYRRVIDGLSSDVEVSAVLCLLCRADPKQRRAERAMEHQVFMKTNLLVEGLQQQANSTRSKAQAAYDQLASLKVEALKIHKHQA